MVLLECGSDIKACDNLHNTPLLWAALRGRETIFRFLLEHGADIKVRDRGGRTPLKLAREGWCRVVVQLLIEASN
jgi:ankyrin repeat protein